MSGKSPLTPEELQEAVRLVVADYRGFLTRLPAPGTQDDPKAFTAHHAAARSALAHLEHLLKLTRSSADADTAVEATALIAEARRSIQAAEQEDRLTHALRDWAENEDAHEDGDPH